MKGKINTTPKDKDTIQALWNLTTIILNTLNFNDVVNKVVNSILSELDYLNLGYKIIVLALIDKDRKFLKRIAISQTPQARKALKLSAVPFKEIDIPLQSHSNLCVTVIKKNKPLITTKMTDVLCPPLRKDQVTPVQKILGIKSTMVYPVISKGKTLGVMIFSLTKREDQIKLDERELLTSFANIVGLAVQNSQLYSSLEEVSSKLKHANERLKDMDELKDEFVSLASHELRTPMTAIRSYLFMALQQKAGVLNDKQKYYLDRSYQSTTRLIRLVNDMLNVSRIESGRMSFDWKKINIVDLVNEVVSELKPKAEEMKIAIKISFKKPILTESVHGGNSKLKSVVNKLSEYDADSIGKIRTELAKTEKQDKLWVIADPDKIKEVIVNLIGNSLKFTPIAGVITICFGELDGFIVTSVSDTGEGIVKEDLPKLFHKFSMIRGAYKSDEKASQGTGLGLYISKSIIQTHGGDMWATSSGQGHGATFSFSLKSYNTSEFEKMTSHPKGQGLGIIHTEV